MLRLQNSIKPAATPGAVVGEPTIAELANTATEANRPLGERIALLEEWHRKLSTEYFDVRAQLKDAEASHDLCMASGLKEASDV